MNSASLYCVLVVMLTLLVAVRSGVQVAPDESDEKRAHNIMRFGRGHSIMRFGRAGHNIMHFGKRGDMASEESPVGLAPQSYGLEYQVPSSPADQAVMDALYSYNKKASDLRDRDNVFMHFG